jgi:hypothetical protein
MGAGNVQMNVFLGLNPALPNDSFANRTLLTFAKLHDNGSSYEASREAFEQLSATNLLGHTRWWSWRTPVPGVAHITLFGVQSSVYAEQFRIENGGSLRSLSSTSGNVASMSLHVVPGVEYPLVIDALDPSDTDYSFGIQLIPDGPAPGNDFFDYATQTNTPIFSITGTLRTATGEPSEPQHDGAPAKRSLWWRWTAPDDGSVLLNATTLTGNWSSALYYRPRLVLYAGESLDSLSVVTTAVQNDTNALQSTLQFSALAGEKYYIALDSGNPDDSQLEDFTLDLTQFPTNDQFDSRKVLSGELAKLSGTVIGATREPEDWIAQPPSSWPNPALMTVWWEWTAPRDLRVTIRNRNPNDHFWAVWRSNQNRSYTPPTSALDRFFGWEDTRRDFVAHAGETWFIAVYADPTNRKPVDMELEGVPVPDNDDFENRTILTGETLRLSSRADNTSRQVGESPHGIAYISLPYGKTADATTLWWSWTAPRSGTFYISTVQQIELLPQNDPWAQVARSDIFIYQGTN